ncbi:hypothetical protein AVEN_132449-1 [Araneus ventricosus]|uniref:Uncharacterized protein n=1 Tax=Araneus ventricosus TaxID=182803 RepID=A0A4Y2RVJ2_ARAVE|nr:hypothetical protein AVEN_132449-1 [Araneus ventricosus]
MLTAARIPLSDDCAGFAKKKRAFHREKKYSGCNTVVRQHRILGDLHRMARDGNETEKSETHFHLLILAFANSFPGTYVMKTFVHFITDLHQYSREIPVINCYKT